MAARTILVTNKYFAIQDLVIAENVVQHLLVETVLGWCLESNLHATGLFVLQVDVSVPNLACCNTHYTPRLLTGAVC